MSVGEALFTAEGIWSFFDGIRGCADEHVIDEKEGIALSIYPENNYLLNSEWYLVVSQWKILRLTNKELKIEQIVTKCFGISPCFFRFEIRTLTFEKQ